MKSRLAAVLAALLVVSACGSSDSSDGGGGQRTLNVFAAASLTEAFGAIKKRFEAEHPGVEVKLNLGGSSTLAQQIVEGAPADVFASANPEQMSKLTSEGMVSGDPVPFASNKLTIAVQPGNPKNIRYFPELQTKKDLRVVVCAPEVPCGAATEKLEQSTGVALKPVSEEQDVKAVLTKVETGEADAGMVYVTDVVSAGDKVEGVSFARSSSAINEYQIAVPSEAPSPDLASEFRDMVTLDIGKQELRKVGFGTY